MSLKEKIFQLLSESTQVEDIRVSLQAGKTLLFEGLWNTPKALLSVLAEKTTGKNILFLAEGKEENNLLFDLEFFSERPVLEFPAWETLPNENIPPSRDIVGERYRVLDKILKKEGPVTVVSNLQSLLQKLVPKKRFQNHHLNLKIGEEVEFETLIQKLSQMGYERVPRAQEKGEFAHRGGIIDVYPVSSRDPYRLEFFGNTLESIRKYDPIGQKSVEKASEIEITLAKELEMLQEAQDNETLLDYLGEDTLVIFNGLVEIEDRYADLIGLLGAKHPQFASLEELFKKIAPLQKIYFSDENIESLSDISVKRKKSTSFFGKKAEGYEVAFDLFERKLSAYKSPHPFLTAADYLMPERDPEEKISGEEIFFSLGRLAKNCRLYLLSTTESDKAFLQKRIADASLSLPTNTHLDLGYLTSGFAIASLSFLVLPTAEFTGKTKVRRQKLRSTFHTAGNEIYELSPGEIVVHLNHGIGKFLGQENGKSTDGTEKEHLLIEYAEGARLFVPMNQSHLVTKYIGSNDESPKFHILGGKQWLKVREKTERAIIGYAKELLELYAKREWKGGFSFKEDSPDLASFEEEFPYEETEDQLSAISAIKKDMISNKAMDRLICGDVGYGKTEVAMRAAFKAVLDGGKQVALLVPTTVLAMQHYENFKDRMGNFPLRVGLLSRFCKPKEIKQTLEGIQNGSIDIVIGTHRIVSQDVIFKDLGLIIIDEEHRFGVKAKEHLKRIKSGVDCLTLSATPIPRTLYMSLVGARDISVINTPPYDRIPIKTFIVEPTDALIKTALLREMTRDGQVYFIHNRVETLPQIADKLKKLIPEARIGIVHGQMSSDEIDKTFHAFKSGHIDILCATTIVESGLDIPNANTILIDRADHFGLAELYQLRGRVGRWNRLAYAYFLVKKFSNLPELSRKRLTALSESVGFGGGMKLALRDLEIRGAGDILGLEQSGHVSAIGFHFYCKLLTKTIKTLQGQGSSVFSEVKMDFPFDYRLPNYYVNEPSLRRELYHRLGDATSFEEVDAIWSEINDRFGSPPIEALWLYHMTKIRVFAAKLGLDELKLERFTLVAVRKKGKEAKERRFLIGKIQDPKELEKNVIKALSSL